MNKIRNTLLAVGLTLTVSLSSVQAVTSTTLLLDSKITPNTPDVATWVTALLEADGVGGVNLTLASPLLAGGTSGTIDCFFLNFNDTLDLNALTITPTGGMGALTVDTITFDENNLQADGDGMFDIKFAFSDFDGTDTATFNITSSADTITDADFNYLSVTGGGQGNFYAAVMFGGGMGPGSASMAAAAWIGADDMGIQTGGTDGGGTDGGGTDGGGTDGGGTDGGGTDGGGMPVPESGSSLLLFGLSIVAILVSTKSYRKESSAGD